jgi:hypothetical protein
MYGRFSNLPLLYQRETQGRVENLPCTQLKNALTIRAAPGLRTGIR